MEKLTIYKNKGETVKCNFKIEGAEPADTIVRLCLEFKDNPNYFFYGNLAKNGDCVIEIPRLKHLDEEQGILAVEVIADSVYFKVYEAEVEFKNSVEVSMHATPSIKKASPIKIKLKEISQTEAPEPTEEEEEVVMTKEQPKVETTLPPPLENDFQIWGDIGVEPGLAKALQQNSQEKARAFLAGRPKHQEPCKPENPYIPKSIPPKKVEENKRFRSFADFKKGKK
jgi:hypothetical protein